MSQQSLADRAVETLAAIREMDAGVDIGHVERHAIWGMKRTAEAILANAMSAAMDLAYQAQGLRDIGDAHRAAITKGDSRG